MTAAPDEGDTPYIALGDEEPIHGCMTVCRYLGREWRLLPINPVGAALVDEALELLQQLCDPWRTTHCAGRT